jgi:hypothetical protein
LISPFVTAFTYDYCFMIHIAYHTHPRYCKIHTQQVMTPFDMRIRAEEYSKVSNKEWSAACSAMTAAVNRLSTLKLDPTLTFEPPLSELRTLSDRLRIDLPDIHLSLDRDDSTTLGDVVRNVLLAPPFESSNSKPLATKESAPKSDDRKEYHIVSGQHLGQWNCDSKESRYALKALVEQELTLLSQERALSPPQRVRVVEFNLGKGTWLLKPTQNDTRGCPTHRPTHTHTFFLLS